MKPAIRILALTAMAALVTAALTGCGTKAHQVVTDEGACLTCHKGDFAVDRSGKFSTSGAVYSTTGQLTVTVTGVDAFFVCRAMPTTQGEKAIPVPILLRGPIPSSRASRSRWPWSPAITCWSSRRTARWRISWSSSIHPPPARPSMPSR